MQLLLIMVTMPQVNKHAKICLEVSWFLTTWAKMEKFIMSKKTCFSNLKLTKHRLKSITVLH